MPDFSKEDGKLSNAVLPILNVTNLWDQSRSCPLTHVRGEGGGTALFRNPTTPACVHLNSDSAFFFVTFL